MFLKIDSDRSGYISKENIKDLFRQISLPIDDDIVNTVSIKNISIILDYISIMFNFLKMMQEAGQNEQGSINLYNFMTFFDGN
jgi:Ca2+-binding EF-hand superfamily protein